MEERCAIVLAGGQGTRLRPYTIAIPKPLVPVGESPILELIIRQLVYWGYTKLILAVNHQAELIKAYFGDGANYGIQIEYSLEKKPLSTMGPLKLIDQLPSNFLIMNGDVLTDLEYGAFLDQHISEKRLFSIAAHNRVQKIDYGVLFKNEKNLLYKFEEKPDIEYLVSMGVYAASKRILEFIPSDTFWGFDDLMKSFLKLEEAVTVVPYDGYWLDIGRPDDYETAVEDFEREKHRFLFNKN